MSYVWPGTFEDVKLVSVRKRRRMNNNGHCVESHSTAWIDRHAPNTYDDLAVHKKKIAEVETWIMHSKTTKGAPILLLTGQSGCGKSATLKVIAAAHSVIVHEWTNPLSIPFSANREAGVRHENLSNQFEEFLFRSGRYPSLELSDNLSKQSVKDFNDKKMLLLEDLPHHLIREPSSFESIMRQYTRFQKHPLVIILSDGSIPDFIRRKLLPLNVLAQLKVKSINFNPISTTSMTKALKRIVSKENQKMSKDVITSVVSSASGDIRAAINSLQFILQKGALLNLSSPVPKKSKMLQAIQESVDLNKCNTLPAIGGKDVSLVLFRALGKILYCKRKEPESEVTYLPPHLEHCHRDPHVFEPEEILDHCCLSGPSYSLFLHHNCVPFFSKTDDLSSTLTYLCASDIIGTRRSGVDFSVDSITALDAYEGSIAARALAFCNSDRATLKRCESATGKWRPFHKPSWYQVNTKSHENQAACHRLFWNLNLPNQELLLTLLPYLQKISEVKLNDPFISKELHLGSLVDPSQKEFLSSVVHLPMWKFFFSGNAERITECEIGEQTPEQTNSDVVLCLAADGENMTPNKNPDEDFDIEEFKD